MIKVAIPQSNDETSTLSIYNYVVVVDDNVVVGFNTSRTFYLLNTQ